MKLIAKDKRSTVSNEKQRPRVVFDCMVFLRSLIKESGPSVECLELFEHGAIELFISDALFVELTDVLTRPTLRRKYPLLTMERADRLINSLRERATLIDPIPNRFTYQRDPKDEPYVNLALAIGATYLISDDNDLLDLMKETESGRDFRAQFPDLKIVNPVVFIRELGE
jgi:putative PIN family toxin of toxin-antitoxin system